MTLGKHQNGLRVLKPGIFTLVQDLGRYGYQHLGLAPGGAADEHAYLWANKLLGNHPNSAALEITFGGLELEVVVRTRVAITGADLQAQCNGRPMDNWQTHNLESGDQLRFGYPKHGVRGYLAVQKGFRLQPSFGSVSTVMRERVGGLDGQGSPLKEGDLLPCDTAEPGPLMRTPSRYIPDYQQPLTLGVIEGHQSSLFSPEELQCFYSTDYTLSNQSDRMGVRLEGAALHPRRGGIISEGINFGAIQVPPDGQPIILLKDRQTIGGYPKLGTLFARDAFSLAQRQPNTTVRFEVMTAERAERDLREFYRFLYR